MLTEVFNYLFNKINLILYVLGDYLEFIKKSFFFENR